MVDPVKISLHEALLAMLNGRNETIASVLRAENPDYDSLSSEDKTKEQRKLLADQYEVFATLIGRAEETTTQIKGVQPIGGNPVDPGKWALSPEEYDDHRQLIENFSYENNVKFAIATWFRSALSHLAMSDFMGGEIDLRNEFDLVPERGSGPKQGPGQDPKMPS